MTGKATRSLIARIHQGQDRAEDWKQSCREWEDKALDYERERDEAVARAEKAERFRDDWSNLAKLDAVRARLDRMIHEGGADDADQIDRILGEAACDIRRLLDGDGEAD